MFCVSNVIDLFGLVICDVCLVNLILVNGLDVVCV